MSFRTVVINKHCKLDYRMNYMVVRQPEGKKRIYLDEIEVLTVVAHGLQVLLVDNQAYPHLPLERRRIIDMDLCEI